MLPASIGIHSVQPVSLLNPNVNDPLVEQWVEPPPVVVEVDGYQEYQVPSLEDSRLYWSHFHYVISCTGYDSLTGERARFVDGLQRVG